MTTGALRSLTLKSITAGCPVVLLVQTDAGPVEVELDRWTHEPEYQEVPGDDGQPKKRLVRERLVIHGRAVTLVPRHS